MRKILTAFAALGLIAALGVAGPTWGAGNGAGSHGTSDTDCTPNGNIETSPTTLWPPNHKDVTITFTYTDPDQAATLDIISKQHNEIVDDEEINGTGNTPLPDATSGMGVDGGAGDADGDDNGVVVVETTARSERSGHMNDEGGRVYSYEWMCSDDDGQMESSDPDDDTDDITLFVPHDCRGGRKAGACFAN